MQSYEPADKTAVAPKPMFLYPDPALAKSSDGIGTPPCHLRTSDYSDMCKLRLSVFQQIACYLSILIHSGELSGAASADRFVDGGSTNLVQFTTHKIGTF